MASADDKPVRPAAAVARHLEWLDFALAAARDEETRRRGRLEHATDKNRERRTARLAEVSAEVRELDALVGGLRNLQARAATTATRRTSRGKATATRGAASTAASATPKATTSAAATRRTRAISPASPAGTSRSGSAAPTTASPAAKARTKSSRPKSKPVAGRSGGRSAKRATPST